MNDNANALQYLVTADTLKRADYYNLRALLDFYLKTDIKSAGETANKFVGSQGRTNVNYYLDGCVEIVRSL